MKLCKWCQKNPAVIPDRTRQGRPIKAVCRECHAAELTGDLVNVLRRAKERTTDELPKPGSEC